MTPTDQLAWDIYCARSAGAMSARDYWDDLSEKDKEFYRKEATAIQLFIKQLSDTVEQLLIKQMVGTSLTQYK